MTYKTREEEKKDFNSILTLCLILDWGFSFMMWGILDTAHERIGIIFVLVIVSICIIKPICGIVICNLKKISVNQTTVLYFGISTIVYSFMFFWMFYEELYKIALINSPLYLIIGIIGYVACVGLVINYRYKIYKGIKKDKSGAPKYYVIGIITIVGSIFVKGYFERLGEGMKQILIAVLMLFISYVLSFGFVQLFYFWTSLKHKKNT